MYHKKDINGICTYVNTYMLAVHVVLHISDQDGEEGDDGSETATMPGSKRLRKESGQEERSSEGRNEEERRDGYNHTHTYSHARSLTVQQSYTHSCKAMANVSM